MYPPDRDPVSSAYLPDRPRLGHPHLPPAADLASLPSSKARTEVTQTGPCDPGPQLTRPQGSPPSCSCAPPG